MKFAFMSDIHANLPALTAAIAAAEDCEVIVCCGDLVGYYAEPQEVCEFFQSNHIPCVAGNHDLIVTGQLEYTDASEPTYRVNWTRAQLSARTMDWLGALPFVLEFECAGLRMLVRHASPWDTTTYLYPDSAAIQDVSLAENEVLVVGHTHRQMKQRVGRGLLLNPGSIGQPRGAEPPGASFAVFDTGSRQFCHRRANYDWSTYQRRLRELGWPEGTVERLSGAAPRCPTP